MERILREGRGGRFCVMGVSWERGVGGRMADLELGDLVLAEPEFFERCKGFQILDFLQQASMTLPSMCRG